MSKGSDYRLYTPPPQVLNEAGSPVTYEPYQHSFSTDRAVVNALRSEGMPPEEIAVADAEFMMMDLEVADGEQLDSSDTNSLLLLLGSLSLQYVAEREQLPMPSDDKRTLKLKRQCRIERAVQTEVMTRVGAEELSGGLREDPLMLLHSRETLRHPPLLYGAESTNTKIRKGYVLDYSEEAEVRSRVRFESGYDEFEEAYDIAQTRISPANFSARLEIGLEERYKGMSLTRSYEGLYRIVAQQRNYRLTDAAVESIESPGYVTRDEMLFVIAVLDKGIEALRKTPAYPAHDRFIRKLHKNR